MVSVAGAYAMDKAVPLRASMGRDYLFSGRELAGAEFPSGYDERAAEVRVKAEPWRQSQRSVSFR